MVSLDVIIERLLFAIYLGVFLILLVANFKRILIWGIQEIAAQAEERWTYGTYEMWLSIFFHSIAEACLFVVLCLLRPIELFIQLPSVIDQVKREWKKEKEEKAKI